VGGEDYRYHVFPNPKDFLKFDLPRGFYKTALKWAKLADEYNHAVFEKRK
jgi:hypothetical protein